MISLQMNWSLCIWSIEFILVQIVNIAHMYSKIIILQRKLLGSKKRPQNLLFPQNLKVLYFSSFSSKACDVGLGRRRVANGIQELLVTFTKHTYNDSIEEECKAWLCAALSFDCHRDIGGWPWNLNKTARSAEKPLGGYMYESWRLFRHTSYTYVHIKISVTSAPLSPIWLHPTSVEIRLQISTSHWFTRKTPLTAESCGRTGLRTNDIVRRERYPG